MRTVTYGAACSLDGFITGPGGAMDWLQFTRDAQQLIGEYWPKIDTILMGRKTWEVAAASGQGGGGESSGIRSYVFSRSLKHLSQPGVELVRDDAGGFVRRLKQQPGKDICLMGGGELASTLLAAGVVDEVGLNIHPVLLGAGIPMFVNPGRRVPLELLESRKMEGGCVLARYRVKADGE
ncbi:MAG TPA: dihydrofolate reductase family protein [Gemmatimonadales bacterium]|nr:dihydrofolate reductase family protein [Gemmatimonadales bacterium]